MVATNWISRFWPMVCLFFYFLMPNSAFSSVQTQIRTGICFKHVHQGLIEAFKQQNRPGGRRDTRIFRNFSTSKVSKIREHDKKIREDSTPETLLFCFRILSRRLLQIPRILEAFCVEISTLVPKIRLSYTKSSYGPLVSAILKLGSCPLDMSWELLPTIFSATLDKDLVRTDEEIEVFVNFLYWGILPEFRRHKVVFLEFEKPD